MNKQTYSIDLYFDSGWQDFVKDQPVPGAFGPSQDLMLCVGEAQDTFDVPKGTQHIRVHVSNRHTCGEKDHYLTPGRNGHWFLRDSVENEYARHYLYTPADLLLEELLKEWQSDGVFIYVEVLEDER
jgi:hypothetical protein